MTDLDQNGLDFGALQTAWQDEEPATGADGRKWHRLARRARLTGWWLRGLFWTEMILCPLVMLGSGWILLRRGGWAETVMMLIAGVWLAGYLYASWRRHAAGRSGQGEDTLAGLLQLQIDQSRQVLSYISLNLKSYFVVVLLLPLALYIMWSQLKDGWADAALASMLIKFALMDALLIGYAVWLVLWRRRTRKALARLEATLHSLINGPTDHSAP